MTVLDASLLQDNLYFIKTREDSMKDKSIREITRMIADCFDIIYFSARKFQDIFCWNTVTARVYKLKNVLKL